jgi:hypothetical protein
MPAPANTPVPEMDIGQQVIEAVQKPGLITEVNTTIAYLDHAGEEYQHEIIKAWLDFSSQRVRIEGWMESLRPFL